MYTIRLAQDTDARELLALNRKSNTANHIAEDVSYISESLKKNTSETVYVVESGDSLVGFIATQTTYSFAYFRPTAEITEIFVKPDFRGQGIGKALVNKVMTESKACNALELFLRVNRKNEAALGFYQHCGFTQAAHYIYRIKYYESP